MGYLLMTFVAKNLTLPKAMYTLTYRPDGPQKALECLTKKTEFNLDILTVITEYNQQIGLV